MFVLSRSRQQSIVIGGDDVPRNVLKVTVLEIRGGRVKLGLEIPAGIRIHRREVSEANGAGVLKCHPDARPAAFKQESDRWEDDGGGPGVPAGVPAVLHAAMYLAAFHR